MNEPSKLLNRIDTIKESVKNVHGAVGLLGLGSIGSQRERLDTFSDLDFFVLTKTDQDKYKLLNNVDWLEKDYRLSFKFKNTKDGYKALYEDGIFIELAIFTLIELQSISYSTGKLLWIDDSINPDSIPLENNLPSFNKTVDWILGELLTNIYIGLLRFHRGEKMSANKFVYQYAVDRYLELLILKLEKNPNSLEDQFSLDRRVEFNYPGIESYLRKVLNSYEEIPASCKAMLNGVKEFYSINEDIEREIVKFI